MKMSTITTKILISLILCFLATTVRSNQEESHIHNNFINIYLKNIPLQQTKQIKTQSSLGMRNTGKIKNSHLKI